MKWADQSAPSARPHQRGHRRKTLARPSSLAPRHRPLPHRAHVLHRLRAAGKEPRAPARHQEMILADEKVARSGPRQASPIPASDSSASLSHDGFPVTIRLTIRRLHEFVHIDRAKQEELARGLGKIDVEKVARPRRQLHEANHARASRLPPAITYPESSRCRCAPFIEAANRMQKAGVKVLPEIMHPLVLDRKELSILETSQTRRVPMKTDQKIRREASANIVRHHD